MLHAGPRFQNNCYRGHQARYIKVLANLLEYRWLRHLHLASPSLRLDCLQGLLETKRCCRAYFEQAYLQESVNSSHLHEADVLGGDSILMRRAWKYRERNRNRALECRSGKFYLKTMVVHFAVRKCDRVLFWQSEVELS